MGNRVAELRTPQDDDRGLGWVVFQSTSMAMFTPIFHNQLAAELFSCVLADIYPRWETANELRLASDVNQFLVEALGDQPNLHESYDEFLGNHAQFQELLERLRACRRGVKS